MNKVAEFQRNFQPIYYHPILEFIDKSTELKLIPRHIIQVLDLSLTDAFSKNLHVLDPSSIKNVIDEISSLQLND